MPTHAPGVRARLRASARPARTGVRLIEALTVMADDRRASSTDQRSRNGHKTGYRRTRRGARSHDYPVEGTGWVLFAGIMIIMVGVLNIIWGIAAIGNSSFFVGHEVHLQRAQHVGLDRPDHRGAAARGRLLDLGGRVVRPLVRHRRRDRQRDRRAPLDPGLSVLVARDLRGRRPRDLRAGGLRRRSPDRGRLKRRRTSRRTTTGARMSTLIAIAYPDRNRRAGARRSSSRRRKEHLVELQDAVVVEHEPTARSSCTRRSAPPGPARPAARCGAA